MIAKVTLSHMEVGEEEMGSTRVREADMRARRHTDAQRQTKAEKQRARDIYFYR